MLKNLVIKIYRCFIKLKKKAIITIAFLKNLDKNSVSLDTKKKQLIITSEVYSNSFNNRRISSNRSVGTIFRNSLRPNYTPSHDGTGQALHPSVIDFEGEFNKKWCNYRFWMAMTPYSYFKDSEEDPNLLASNDGVNWETPIGISNPLDKAVGSPFGYNADPELIYNEENDELWLYYRYYSQNEEKLELKLIKIKNDLSYTKPKVLINIQPYDPFEDKFRSLCIWKQSQNQWHMWGNGGNIVNSKQLTVWYCFSKDGENWGDFKQVLNENGCDPFLNFGFENWHKSCKPNYDEDKVEFLVYARPLYSQLVFSLPFQIQFLSHENGGGLFHSYCNMSKLDTMIVSTTKPILSRGKRGSWDEKGLYRSSFTISQNKDEKILKVWYTGINNQNECHIGYTEGCLIEK